MTKSADYFKQYKSYKAVVMENTKPFNLVGKDLGVHYMIEFIFDMFEIFLIKLKGNEYELAKLFYRDDITSLL